MAKFHEFLEEKVKAVGVKIKEVSQLIQLESNIRERIEEQWKKINEIQVNIMAEKAKLSRNIKGGFIGSTSDDKDAREPVKHPEYASGRLLVLYINVESNAMPKKVRSGTRKVKNTISNKPFKNLFRNFVPLRKPSRKF